MGKFHTYSYLELKDNTSATHINTRSRVSIKHTRRLKKVFVFGGLLLLVCIFYNGIFLLLSHLVDEFAIKIIGYEGKIHYAVIIDAGSSGTRVLAYIFNEPYSVFGAPGLRVIDEFFEQSKPGLSSYADDPEKGAQTVVDLIKKSEVMTPPEKRHSIPIIVRATAGLRLLPADKAQRLIDHVAKAISQLGYDTGPDSVGIMDGTDEGVFIWYTVNCLQGLMNSQYSMAALDLGGGSTQIAYALSPKEVPFYPHTDKFTPPPFRMPLYAHSYLGLGLLAARYGILRMEAGDNDTNEFVSICVSPIIQKELWTYDNKEYIVSGPATRSKNGAAYSACGALVRSYVLRTMDWQPPAAPDKRVAAVSYFYDVAVDAGLVELNTGGTVTVEAYRRAGRRACAASNVEQPWACLDLLYIATLLHDGYKIPASMPISLYKKVWGHEVSWALGLAYLRVLQPPPPPPPTTPRL